MTWDLSLRGGAGREAGHGMAAAVVARFSGAATAAKFELLESDRIALGGHVLRRVRALRDIGDVQAGTLGGYVESAACLDAEGLAWVGGLSMVYGGARVRGDARIDGRARLFGGSRLTGAARLDGAARVGGRSWVGDRARVEGSCVLMDVHVGGAARVSGAATVSGGARIGGDARIDGRVLIDGPVWLGWAPGLPDLPHSRSRLRPTAMRRPAV